MTRKTRLGPLLGAGILAGLSACAPAKETQLTGYGEAVYVYAAPLDPGRVVELNVREGDEVKAGGVLFRLDPSREQSAVAAANAQAMAARDRGLGASAETIRRWEANLELAQLNLSRTKTLFDKGLVSKARLDQDAANVKATRATLDEARKSRIASARDVEAANAQVGLARTRLKDFDVASPASGRVERIYRRPGEVVRAGEPVLAILSPDNMKVRFFAPQALLPKLPPGAQIMLSCDGCEGETPARVSYVASAPQFTPPILYGKEDRAKLVFLVEAVPNGAHQIRPGLPVDIRVPS